MPRPALATVSDFEDLLGTQVDVSPTRVEALLAHASEIVRAYAGVTWLNDDEDDVEDVPAQIPMIVASMVERATSNPLGITQESAGPFSRSFGPDASQRLYLTKQERAIVRAAVGVAVVMPMGTTRGELEIGPVLHDAVLDPPAVEEYDPFSVA